MQPTKRDDAERVITQFLEGNESPTVGDWKRLADGHPEFAAEIVNAALIRTAGDRAQASDERYEPESAALAQSVSRFLNKLYQLDEREFENVKMAVSSMEDIPARRKAAEAVGIGRHVNLFSGILAGRTIAPRRVLRDLEPMFHVSSDALQEYFAQVFERYLVPSHKALGEKPSVYITRSSWREAVLAAGLDPQEVERLLKLDDDQPS